MVKLQNCFTLDNLFITLCLFSAGFSTRVDKMMKNGPEQVTRLLFCGLEFPASHTYTIEYLKKYPFIQVLDLHFLMYLCSSLNFLSLSVEPVDHSLLAVILFVIQLDACLHEDVAACGFISCICFVID